MLYLRLIKSFLTNVIKYNREEDNNSNQSCFAKRCKTYRRLSEMIYWWYSNKTQSSINVYQKTK